MSGAKRLLFIVAVGSAPPYVHLYRPSLSLIFSHIPNLIHMLKFLVLENLNMKWLVYLAFIGGVLAVHHSTDPEKDAAHLKVRMLLFRPSDAWHNWLRLHA